MITVNGKKFAKTQKEFMETLFSDAGTANGFYKVLKNGVRLYNIQNEPFAFIYDNGFCNRGVVTCRKHGTGHRYLFTLIDCDCKLLGLENNPGLRVLSDIAEDTLNKLFPDKYK